MPTEIQSAYGGLLSSFVNALWSLVDPHEMTIDPDAVEMLLDFHDEIEPRLAKEGDLRPLGGFVGKIVGSAARFAALHHLGWYGPSGRRCRSPPAASPAASSWRGTPSSTTAT